MDVVPSSAQKAAEPMQARVRVLCLTWRLFQLWVDPLSSLQQVSEQTWAEAEVAAVKSNPHAAWSQGKSLRFNVGWQWADISLTECWNSFVLERESEEQV